ncbi:MAG TPA: tyrosine-type recombinase/integrase, partial [Phenylobacterium sp.]|nr:tyrosine-type recombinase/integrase [Phenylobacterium sp.]
ALNWHGMRDQVKTFAPDELPLHWHDLRHTAAVFLLDAGLPAPDVPAILGHSSLLVTQLYADTRRLAARRGVEPLSRFYDAQSVGHSGGGESPAEIRPDLDI